MVFSNAALHWVPDHGRVFSGIASALRPGGRALLQMSGRGNAAPILALADEMLGQEPWNGFFSSSPPRYAFYDPKEERRWLVEAGLTPVQVKLMEKDMTFDDLDGLAEWVRTIRHLYLEHHPEEARPAFVAEVVSRYIEKYPSDDGRIHVPMVRLEVEAKDPE